MALASACSYLLKDKQRTEFMSLFSYIPRQKLDESHACQIARKTIRVERNGGAVPARAFRPICCLALWREPLTAMDDAPGPGFSSRLQFFSGAPIVMALAGQPEGSGPEGLRCFGNCRIVGECLRPETGGEIPEGTLTEAIFMFGAPDRPAGSNKISGPSA